MDDGLARLNPLENARRVQGVRFRRVSRRKKCCGGRRLGVERLKKLSQILKQRARQPEICGFESFREAIVDEGERMPGPITLPVFEEHAGQGHRRPQLPGERGLRTCDSKRLGQAVHGCFSIMLCRSGGWLAIRGRCGWLQTQSNDQSSTSNFVLCRIVLVRSTDEV